MNRNQLYKTVFGLLVGIALMGLVFYFGGTSSFQKLKGLNPIFVLLAFLSIFAIAIFVTWRWKTILSVVAEGAKIKGPYLFQHLTLSKVAGLFVPKEVSEFAIRGIGANLSEQVSVSDTFQSVFFDRLFDVFVLATFILPAVLFFLFYSTEGTSLAVYLLALAFLVGFLILRTNPLRMIKRICGNISRFRVFSKYKFWQRICAVKFDRLEAHNFRRPFMLSLIKFFFNVSFLYFLSKALNLEIPIEVLFWGAAIAQLAFLIAVTPSGLGILELGWFGVFLVAGLDKPDIVYFIATRRIFSILSMALLLVLSFSFNSLRSLFACGRKVQR